MSNLDNIIKEILDDAKKEAEEIIEKANQEKSEIIETKTSQANEEKDAILKKAELEAKSIYDRYLSQVRLRARDEELFAKQEVIDSVIEKVKHSLLKLSLEDYKKYLKLKLSEMNIEDKDILLLQEDKYNFLKDEDFKIKVSEKTVDSGFCIKRNNIMLNNDFSSLVDSMTDELELEIVKTLFKK